MSASSMTSADSRGFTLVELMIVVTLMIIVAMIAAPSYRDLMMRTQVTSVTEELLSAFSTARLEALKRKVPVSVCRTLDGLACAGTGDWGDGLMIYVDSEDELSADTGVGAVLKVWANFPPNLNIEVTRDDAEVTFVRYTSLGTQARVEDFDSVFVVNLDDCDGLDAQRRLFVHLSGLSSVVNEICPEE